MGGRKKCPPGVNPAGIARKWEGERRVRYHSRRPPSRATEQVIAFT